MELNPIEIEKLPKDVRAALHALVESTAMIDCLCEMNREKVETDSAYQTVATLAHRASNKILGYCRTPNDTDFKAKLRKLVWSRTHAC